MAFITLEDKGGQIDVVCFSDIYLENESTFKAGEPIWIKGNLEISEGGAKILLSKKNNSRILPLRYAYEALAREMHVYYPLYTGSSFNGQHLKTLQSYLQNLPDKTGGPLYFHMEVNDKTRTILKARESVPFKRDTVDYVRKLLEQEPVRDPAA